MLSRIFVVSLVGFVSGLAAGQRDYAAHAWKGTFEIHQYNLQYKTGRDYVHNKDLVVREVELWTYSYDLYEGSNGIVRQELKHLNRNRSVGPPMDIRILNYPAGSGLVFDKGGQQAAEGPLVPPAPARDLGTRQILGLPCAGREYGWKTFQGAMVELQRWSAVEPGPRVPLLEVSYFTNKDGALLALTVEVVTKLEPATSLPDSLFEPPEGLKTTRVPLID